MDASSTLQTLCEVAIAIAGFTAVVIAIRPVGARSDPVFFRWSLQFLTASVAAALFFSVLPLSLLAFELSPRPVWAVSSGALAIGNLLLATWASIQQQRLFGRVWHRDLRVLVSFAALYGTSILVSTLNALDIVFHREFGGYLLPLLIWFSYPLFAFFLMVLRSEDDNA
jgi:hypothetical protein